MKLRLALALAVAALSVQAADLQPIDISGFQSSISHWRNIKDDSRFILVEPNQPSYQPGQVREIVANILLFQRANGGWPKDYDMTAILTPAQREKVIATHENRDSSYDNGNLHSQVEYLARAYTQTNDPAWRAACERGFDFMLASQYENGGFPQRFPKPTGFHAHITFNDGVMMGIVEAINEAANHAPHYAWLDDARRNRAREAVKRATDCILKCQLVVNGKRTGWCQQHDEKTFAARPARTFELASICPQETASIIKFLMSLPNPSPEIIAAVNDAVAWLQSARLTGIKLEKVKAAAETFLRHTADFDMVIVQDPTARPIWARHYEIETNRPIFAGRDGVKKYSLAEIERERRTGTAWYGYWPERLLDRDYPKWRSRVR